MRLLKSLNEEVEARGREIAGAHGAWPCHMGCARCCRSLAAVPRLTAPEWDLLRQGLDALPASVRGEIQLRAAALDEASRPIICPMLDTDHRTCLVYEYRPVACRTYGFYVERGEGLYCREIEAMVDSGACAGVTWGNACVVEARLDALGAPLDMRIWMHHDP